MRTLALSVFMTVIVAPLAPTATAQRGPELPIEAGEPATSFNPAGFWEGYDSTGCLWTVQNVADGPGYDAQVRIHHPSGEVDNQMMRFTVTSLGEQREILAMEDGSLVDAIWYGPDGVLLRLPDGVQVALTRVGWHAPRSPALDLMLGDPVEPLTPDLQAELARLEGTWSATMTRAGRPPETATFSITVIDAVSGSLRLVLSDGERSETDDIRVVGGTPGSLQVVGQGDEEPVVFTFIDDDTIEFQVESEMLIRLTRGETTSIPPDPSVTSDSDLACTTDDDCVVSCQIGPGSCCPTYCAPCTYVLNRWAMHRQQEMCAAVEFNCPTVGACAEQPTERGMARCIEGACAVELVPVGE